MHLRRLIAALALAAPLLAAGCSLGSGIASHSVEYNSTVERAADSVLLLNVLRARDRVPLHFSALGAIHGSFGLSAGFGYDLTGASVNGTLPAILGSTSPSFDIGPLDRQEFVRGLMRPIDPGLFRLLSDSGLPDGILLHLLVSRVEDSSGQVVRNDPRRRVDLDPGARRACAAQGAAAPPPCDSFEAMVDSIAAKGRLTFNGYTRLIPVGPRLPASAVADAEKLLALREPGMTLRPEGASGWRLYRTAGQLALCVPEGNGRRTAYALDSDPPQVSPMPQDGDPCGADEVAEQPARAGAAAPPGLSWYLRSVNEVFHYLGDVQQREEDGVPYWVGLGDGKEARLFRLLERQPSRPRMSVDYRGTRWWVAEHVSGEDETTTVLALVSLLLNLQKSAGELPSSGTLRLIR